jgi:5-formyltetrahydrofolate cyclo-ligase
MAKKQLEDDLLTGGSVSADDKSAKKAAKAKKSAEKKAAKAAKVREKNEAKRTELKKEIDALKRLKVQMKRKLKNFLPRLKSSVISILKSVQTLTVLHRKQLKSSNL